MNACEARADAERSVCPSPESGLPEGRLGVLRAPPRLSWRRGLLPTLCRDFVELLRRSRGSGRRLGMLPRVRSRCCSRRFLLLLHLLVMVLVLRGALGCLCGLALRPTRFSRRGRGALRLGGRRSLRRRGSGALRLIWRSLRRRGGGGLRGVLCQYRQRQRKHNERS